MDTAIMTLERQELYSFCDLLPEPIIFELDGAPNVDTARLVIEAANYWQH